jgi:hypothetical protein
LAADGLATLSARAGLGAGTRQTALAPLALGLGVLAAVAIASGATWTAPATALSPIKPEGGWLPAYRIAVVAALVLYVAGAWLVRSRGARLAAVIAIAAAVQLTPLAAPQLFSTDVYSYWDYGRIASEHGGNPYIDLPSRWPDDPAYPLMGNQWHHVTSAYGPLWTVTSEGVGKISGTSSDTTAWSFKTIAAISALLLVAVVVFAARNRPFAAAFVGWNPVLAFHLAGGGHNDALLMAFPIAGLGLAAAGRRELGGSLWPFGVAVKWLPLLLLPLVLARDRLRFGWRGFAAATVAIAAVSTALYGVHWVHAAKPISSQLRRASSTSVPYYVEKYAGIDQYRVTQVLAVLFALVYVWLLRDAWRRGRARLGLTAGLFCLSLSWLPAWYTVWPVSLAALEDDALARWIAVALTAWLLRDAVFAL